MLWYFCYYDSNLKLQRKKIFNKTATKISKHISMKTKTYSIPRQHQFIKHGILFEKKTKTLQL